MPWYASTDQMGRTVELLAPPQRIVSLVPSQTELLFDLGADDKIVGLTRYCVHPEEARKSKTIVGGTKRIDYNLVHKLRPDLVIGNKEENRQADILELSLHYPVWMSDVIRLEDAFSMILSLGFLTERQQEAINLVSAIDLAFDAIQKVNHSVLYLIWQKPWMGAGSGTFIDTTLNRCGLKNVLRDRTRYPILEPEEIQALRPELIFLSSEPFPFTEKHALALGRQFPQSRVLLVDGEMFSWYGSRLLQLPAYFNGLEI